MKLIDSIKRFIIKEKFENLLNKVSGSSISLLLDHYSNKELEICIQHLKDLYNFINDINKEYSLSIISISCIRVDDILNLNISLLNQLIKEEVNTRMYLYNFLKNYISEEITLSENNEEYIVNEKQINSEREFVDTRLTIQDRIDIDEFIKKYVKEL